MITAKQVIDQYEGYKAELQKEALDRYGADWVAVHSMELNGLALIMLRKGMGVE